MKYCVKDMVKFYPNVTTNQVFIGEIADIYMGMNQYKIVYEGSKYCVHEQFIISKASPDDVKIMQLELKISEKDLKIKELTDKLDKFIKQLQNQVDVSINDDERFGNLCKEKATYVLLFTNCRKNLEKAHKEIADLKFKLRKCTNEKWNKNDHGYFPSKLYIKPIKQKVPLSASDGITEIVYGSKGSGKSCGCHVKSS